MRILLDHKARQVYLKALATGAIALVLCTCGAQQDLQRPTLTKPGESGPYTSALYEFTMVDDQRNDRTLPARIWYPVAAPDTDAQEPMNNPVVMYSHGSGAAMDFHDEMSQHLVSRGYVVAMVEHTDNVGLGQFDSPNREIAYHRVMDVALLQRQIARLNKKEPAVAGRLDLARLAVGGHSFGGYTTEVMCGATFDIEQLKADCDESETDEPLGYRCAIVPFVDEMEAAASTEIDACFTHAPSIDGWFGENYEGVADIHSPFLLISGSEDALTQNQTHIDAFEQLPSPSWFATIEGGAHMGFTDVSHEGSIDWDRMKELYITLTDAFVDMHLLQSNEAARILDPNADSFLGNDSDVSMKVK